MKRLFIPLIAISFFSLKAYAAKECPVKVSDLEKVSQEYANASTNFRSATREYLDDTTKDELINFIRTGSASSDFLYLNRTMCKSSQEHINAAYKLRKLAEQMIYLCKAPITEIKDMMTKAENERIEIMEIHGCSMHSDL